MGSKPGINLSIQLRHGQILKVIWQKPAAQWVKLNVDGASKGNPGPAGIGGIIRDSRSNLIKGFWE